MKLVLSLLLALVALPAVAQTPPSCLAPIADPVPRDAVRWSWTAPTTNTDGSAIKTPITYTVYEGATKICITNGTAASWNALSVGAHSWAVTSTTTDGESVKSNVVSKTIAPAPPSPPTSLKVDPAALMAYSPLKVGGQNIVAQVGTVPPNTQCDPSNGVIVGGVTYNTVPIAAVSFTNPAAKPNATAVVARCSG